MCQHAETITPIRAGNWQMSFLYQLGRFKNRNMWYTVQTLFVNESFQHRLI